MKKTILISGLFGAVIAIATMTLLSFSTRQADAVSTPPAAVKEFKIITTIESVVPMGMGRSRIIENLSDDIDYKDLTTERSESEGSKQSSIKRKDAKIDDFAETKILNFYSGVGLNFKNIASNDALVTSKLNEMSKQGWELHSVVSGVESDAGTGDGNGIFITRYLFMRNKQ